MKRLLITGAGGLLGSQLVPLAQPRFDAFGLLGSYPAPLPGRIAQVDLTDGELLERIVREFHPEIVLHAAAMTAPVECEKRPGNATRVNVDTTRQLGALAAELGARFLFVSTDLVFNGQKGMYREGDPVDPLSHYGRTKVLAEQATAGSGANHLIVRTSLMVGHSPRGDRSVNEVIRRAIERGETLQLFSDEYRSLVGARNLAECLLELADSDQTGVLHVTGPQRRSRYEWGVLVARHFGWDLRRIQPVERSKVKLHPPRPADVSLDTTKARGILRTPIQTIEEVLHGLDH